MKTMLWYKEYDYSITLGACRDFNQDTGLCLQVVLMRFLDEYTRYWASDSPSVNGLLVHLGSLYNQRDINKLFYYLFKECNSQIQFAEIEDATFRTGWSGNEDLKHISAPWQLVLVKMATDISDYYSEHIQTKKADT